MEILLLTIFILGYAAIALEHPIKVNKAASALLTGVLCWTVLMLFNSDAHAVNHSLQEHLGELSGILFFLMGAMVIVELIDAHDGFEIITQRIQTTNARKLLWLIGSITFFLSAVLDNLTTAIVMVSLLRKILSEPKDRLFFAGIIVIAANAGGAWSPLGDVTTSMLWIGNQISAGAIVANVLLPSLVCLAAPLVFLTFRMKGNAATLQKIQLPPKASPISYRERNLVFCLGVGGLLFVPVFKTLTHLPPYMGMLLSLGVMWVVTEFLHHEKDTADKDSLSVVHALRKIDVPSVLFFLGILVAVAALQSAGMLAHLATWLTDTIESETIIALAIGLLSAVVDNVPLVAAAQGMYSLEQYPTDHFFWEFLAYCAGTGGSALIIGSAAG
ncbi:MAG: sodium:proton antiporter NhaD, partial [Bacteroidetes bacterium]|nr:sodium:proton antiporter NhaD [Bacteroidota bacterium]